MAYTLNFSIGLGPAATGLTLNAQLVTSAGVDYGAAITTGFTEIGNGYYIWYYASFPDNFRGGVKIYEAGVPLTILVFSVINPEEAENLDEKISEITDDLADKVVISINDLKKIVFG